jgi:TfoX/Sxy family transcriptional regulator of competence genes
MSYSQELADRIRAQIGDHPGLAEKEMFGGIAFLVAGNMSVGVTGNELMVRVGKDAHDEAVALPGARIFDLSSRPMRGWLVVDGEGIDTEDDLEAWIQRGMACAEQLPPK